MAACLFTLVAATCIPLDAWSKQETSEGMCRLTHRLNPRLSAAPCVRQSVSPSSKKNLNIKTQTVASCSGGYAIYCEIKYIGQKELKDSTEREGWQKIPSLLIVVIYQVWTLRGDNFHWTLTTVLTWFGDLNLESLLHCTTLLILLHLLSLWVYHSIAHLVQNLWPGSSLIKLLWRANVMLLWRNNMEGRV